MRTDGWIARARMNLGFVLLFTLQAIKTHMADRGNFWIGFLTLALYQSLGLAFFAVVFAHVPQLAGWSFAEVLFIFGVFHVVSGLFYMLFAWTLWFSRRYLIERRLDVILVRPVPPLLQIAAEGIGNSLAELNGVAIGVGIIAYAAVQLAWQPSPVDVLVLFVGIVLGVLILGGIFTVLAMISFWARATSGVSRPLMQIIGFAQYPITIFPPLLRWVLTFVFPLGLVAYAPSASVLRDASWEWLVIAPSWGLGLWGLVGILWRRGRRRYESAGS